MSSPLLWITEHYPPTPGGMAVSCARQVRELRRHGHRVDLVHLGAAPEADLVFLERDNGTDILVPALGDAALGAHQAWLALAERHARECYRAVAGFGASVAGYHAVTYAAWLGAGSLVLIRGNDLDRDWFLPQRSGWLREALSRATVLGAVTGEKVARLAALYPGKPVHWTPNSVDPARWQFLPADERRRAEVRGLLQAGDARVIGLFGELKAKKRIGWWLEAVRDAGLLDHIRLLVVGSVDLPTAQILDDPAIAPRSLRLPFCRPEELPGLYAACDLVAIPSLFEGMPNVLLEAMACGVVPLVSDAGASTDLLADGDTGFLFRAEDRADAARATARAVALDAPALAAMSARVRDLVSTTFSPARERETLERLLALAAAP